MFELLFLVVGLFCSSRKASAYSAEAMNRDRATIDFRELVNFRGPILKDIWIDPTSVKTEEEVCRRLFHKALATVNATTVPPKEIPPQDRDTYLLGGKMSLQPWYCGSEVFNGARIVNWTKDVLDAYQSKPNVCGQYNLPWCDEITKRFAHFIREKDVAVVGSQYPWAEAAMLNLNPRKLITIEYTKIFSDHPDYITFHPSTVARAYLTKRWDLIDSAFSYSSLEHDGLGRYGDPLNPTADLESIARIRCLLKPGGIFFLGVPVGRDTVAWNAHRIYGKFRLALASLGWNVLDFYPTSAQIHGPPGEFEQPIIVLQKPFSH